MLRLTENIEAEEVRKIYTLNMVHATAAYLGISQAVRLRQRGRGGPVAGPILKDALDESAVGLAGEYGFSKEEMARWTERMMGLIRNPHMADDLIRLGADSLRKLGPDDRLTGAARLSIKHGGKPVTFARAIRMGFLYENADEGTQRVRRVYREKGLAGALSEISGLDPDEPLTHLVLQYE
jgi:mannitol-1-phosphate 5-dehydrogenase